MNKEEREELYKDMKDIFDKMNRSAFQRQTQGNWGSSPPTWQTAQTSSPVNPNLTADDIKNIYKALNNIPDPERPLHVVPFEQDINGTLYGYKVLARTQPDEWLKSPTYISLRLRGDIPYTWENNELTSWKEPTFSSAAGIHGTKRLDDLQEWIDHYKRPLFMWGSSPVYVTVRIAVWGTVVETEKGFRAQHARIMQVLQKGV